MSAGYSIATRYGDHEYFVAWVSPDGSVRVIGPLSGSGATAAREAIEAVAKEYMKRTYGAEPEVERVKA